MKQHEIAQHVMGKQRELEKILDRSISHKRDKFWRYSNRIGEENTALWKNSMANVLDEMTTEEIAEAMLVWLRGTQLHAAFILHVGDKFLQLPEDELS